MGIVNERRLVSENIMLLIQKVADDHANFAEAAMFVLSKALKDGSMSQESVSFSIIQGHLHEEQ